jgi:hypothetical protein
LKIKRIIYFIKHIVFVLQLTLNFFAVTRAQDHVKIIDSITEKMNWYAFAKPSSTLFLHFEKNIYTNYENVWFTGYLLTNDTNLITRNVLSVVLVKNDDRSIWAEDKFVMKNGISAGNIFLPDSIPPGNYSFISYTNILVNGNPVDLFIQPVTIKTTDAVFSATAVMLDSVNSKTDTARILVNAYSSGFHSILNAQITFILGDGIHQSPPHKLKTNKSGDVIFSIPLQEIHPDNNVLHVNIKYNNYFKDLSIRLPIYQKRPKVKFYPEGGNMIDETANCIGWEVKNAEGQPLETSGILYKNQQIIDTIQTSSYGLGKFILTPQIGNHYYVKVLNRNGNDTLYSLPAIFPRMPMISITKAVVNDTLQFTIKNAGSAGKLFFLIHDYRDISLASVFNAKESNYSVKIPLTEVPKGVNTLTLLDSAAKPLAERLFFAHYNSRTLIDVHTNSSNYLKRERVELSLKLHAPDGKTLQGIASLACIQDSRIDNRKMNDIESYVYLTNELQDLPSKHSILSNVEENNEYLEDVLLIKGWRRYTWLDMLQSKSGDTITKHEFLNLDGNILLHNKPVKKPVDLSMIVDSVFYTIQTDSAGGFIIDSKYIVEVPGKKVSLFLPKGSSEYEIKINDKYHKLNERLAIQLIPENNDIPLGSETSESLILKSDEYAKVLDAVTVTSKKNKGYIAWNNPLFNGSDCDDYVCLFGILNCKNHPRGSPGETKPVVGVQYRLFDGQKIVYRGYCNTTVVNSNTANITSMKGVYTAKEFYASDYSKFDPPAPEYISTIYWNPEITLYTDKETKVSFYTSDITGKFRVIVQGEIPGDVIYGEYYFNVENKIK